MSRFVDRSSAFFRRLQAALGLALALAVGTGTAVPCQAAPRPGGAVLAGFGVMLLTPRLTVATGVRVRLRPAYGRLDIQVAPERAKVYLDGRYLGRGDKSRVLPAGEHRVKVVLGDGRAVEAETVWVQAGHVTHVRLNLL